MCSIITGDETGLLKYVSGKSYTRFGEQSRELGVIDMRIINTSTSSAHSETKIVVLRKNSSLEAWKIDEDDHQLKPFDSLIVDVDQPVGILPVIDSSDNQNHRVIVYGKDGSICISRLTDSGLVSINMRASYPNNSSIKAYELQSADDMEIKKNTISIRSPLSAGASCHGGVVFGGQENDLMLYDVNTFQATWQAKNVPHDKLSLRVPVWITAVDFLKPMECDVSTGALIVTGTGKQPIRQLYHQ
jgi:hypothetical protein